MKHYINKLALGLMFMIGWGGMSNAQSPLGLNYQAVITDNQGQALANTSVTLRLGIYSGASGTIREYEESHLLTTSENGLVNLVIGQGSVLNGSFSEIKWGAGAHFVKVEVDRGQGYTNMGMMQLQSVPYALYSSKAGELENPPSMSLNDLNDVNSGAAQNNQVLQYNGSQWVPANPQGNYQAGTGININNNTIEALNNNSIWNAGSLKDRPISLNSTLNSGDVLSWNGSNWTNTSGGSNYNAGNGLQLSGNTFSARNNDALWNAAQLQGRNISSAAPSNGDLLIWNGTNWTYQQASSYRAGNGLSLIGNTFQADSAKPIWNAGQIQGRTLSSASPNMDDVLKWNGSAWAPAKDSLGSGSGSVWNRSGNNIYSGANDRVGINRNNPLYRLQVFDSITNSGTGGTILADYRLYPRPNSSSFGWNVRSVTDINSSVEAISFLGVATGTTSASNSTGAAFYGISDVEATNSYGLFTSAEGATTRNYGVYANSTGTGVFNVGGLFFSVRNSSNSNYGVYAVADSASTAVAGYFDGDLTYTGTLTGPSDQFLKEDIKELNGGLNAIMQLNPKTYVFKNHAYGMRLPEGQQYGFLAQDLEKVFPTLVKEQKHIGNPTGKGEDLDIHTYKSVDYISLIPVLTKALQEQQQMIEQLQQEINDLRKELK